MQQWLYIGKTPISPVDGMSEVRPGEYEFQIPAPMLDSHEALSKPMTLEDGHIRLKCLRWGYQVETVYINAVNIGEGPDEEDEDWLLMNGKATSQIRFHWNGQINQSALIETTMKHWDELGLYIDCARCRMQWCTTDLGSLCYNYNVVPIACLTDQKIQILRLKRREILDINWHGTELKNDELNLIAKVKDAISFKMDS